ncbi:hypothetical protein [Streptomyces sp. WAC06614]|uniref:hypothetical protein n=1 Tax=Streptomyces sp. WAC06614 TaxID=2487416 RepID=UPI0021B084B2|nr:hypothetical protein [Streptomyces sp. WAC06614]
MAKEQKQDLRLGAPGLDAGRAPRSTHHGFDGPVRSKVKGGVHTKAELKRAGAPQGDRIGERTRGLS